MRKGNQQNYFQGLGSGLPPELASAIESIGQQRQNKIDELNAPDAHPVFKQLGRALLGPAGLIGLNMRDSVLKQRNLRQVEEDALRALLAVSQSIGHTNQARNDAGFNTLVKPLFAQAGLDNLPAQSDPANTLKLLGGLNAPAVMQMGNQQIQGGAGAGFNQGLDLMGLFAGAPKARPFPKREDVVTMRPDGGKVANQGGEKYQAPQGDGYEYVPMGMEGSTGIRQVPLQVEAEAAKQLPVYIPEALQSTMLDATQRAMTGASGQVPDFAKLPSQIAAEKALAQQRNAAAALDALRKALLPAESAAQIRQSDASATNSLASAEQTRTETEQLKAMHPLNVQLKRLEMNKGLTTGQMEQLKPYRLQADIAFKALEEQGLVNPDTKEVKLPKGFLGGDKSTPAQRSAYLNHQQATQQLRAEIAKITGSGQPQAQPAQQGKKDYRKLWSN